MAKPGDKLTDDAQRALALHKTGDAAGAEKLYRRILKANPDDGRIGYLLGVACLEQGKFDDGRNVLENALRQRPEDPDILFSLGRALQKLGERDAALRHLETACELAPGRADVWSAIGDVLQLQDRPHDAIAAYARALDLAPDDWRTFANAAMIHIGVGNVDEGAAMLRQVAANQRHPKILLNLAQAEDEFGNHDDAGSLFSELTEMGLKDPELVAGQAVHFQTIGEKQRAWDTIQQLSDAEFESALPTLAFAKIAPQHDDPSQTLTRQAREFAENVIAEPAISTHDRTLLGYALGDLCDRLGEYDAAFDAVETASGLSPAIYDANATEQRFHRLRKFFTAEQFAEFPRSSEHSEVPVFIVGMPRSGTSLVEQILDSHPAAAGAGELTTMPAIEKDLSIRDVPDRLADLESGDLNVFAKRYLSELADIDADASRVTDKLPGNFERLGLIALLFPGARVIHCLRDPLDTCLSCYFQDFRFRNAYSFSLEGLGHYYGQYQALMAHWHDVLPLPVFDIRYETLIEHPKETVAELLEFCGVDWDDRCLAFHENPRIVATASAEQVRLPLYSSSVGRAAHYRHRLGPLVDALAANGIEPGE